MCMLCYNKATTIHVIFTANLTVYNLEATVLSTPGYSTTAAAPIPVPMHIEITPYDLERKIYA